MPALDEWQRLGREVAVFGRRVFVVEAGPAAPTPVIFLHGFPSSTLDLRPAWPALTAGRRWIAHDQLGFGLSEKPADYSYSLLEQADVALGVWRALGVTRAHLVAHDMGTSVACELLARRQRGLSPVDFASVTFCNGSMMLELASLTLSQKLLRGKLTGKLYSRLASKGLFLRQVRRIFGVPVAAAELDAMWEAMTRDHGLQRLPAISSYLDERVRFRERWIESLLPRLDLPVHVLWGRKDPVAVEQIAVKVAAMVPGAKLTWLEPLGHYPMLEDAAAWGSAAMGFIEQAERLQAPSLRLT